MKIARVSLFYYSPTHTTEKIVTSIAAGLGIDPLKIIENNLTYPEYDDALVDVEAGDLVMIGAPVYAGQISLEAHKRLEKIKFAGNPVVLVAVYGNRHFEDALIDLREMAISYGLKPVAAAAFVGEHSYSTRDFPIAKGRPDAEDRLAAREFGAQIAAKMQTLNSLNDLAALKLPGTDPLPPRRLIGPSHAETSPAKCNECGNCLTACPTGAIFFKKGYQTEISRCTICCACVKACGRRARIIISEHIPNLRETLATTCVERKAPQIFI